MKMLKYQGCSIVFSDVPGEISVAIDISGCTHQCAGCHSPNLWLYEGRFLSEDFDKILAAYKDDVTCFCFFGGDQNPIELNSYLGKVRSSGLKTCLYSGSDDRILLMNLFSDNLDYLKVGRYVSYLGGLASSSTNQIMYRIEHIDGSTNYTDITKLFQK